MSIDPSVNRVSLNRRSASEIAHGRMLAERDPEGQWGWGSPAGRLRAVRRADLIARGAGLAAGQRVLEIGCGTGLFTEQFASIGARITAVDLSPDLLAIARRRELAGVEFLQRDVGDLSSDTPFDAVIGSSILHHLDQNTIWARLYSLLRPGGRLSFAEPNLVNPQVFCERRFRRFFPSVSPDETAFVRWGVTRNLERAGFESIDVTPFDWLHPATPEALIPAVRRGGSWLERLWIVREFAGSLIIVAARPRR